jgi:hypothetical protein
VIGLELTSFGGINTQANFGLTFVRTGIEIGTMHENNFQTEVQFLKWAN